MAIKKEVSLNGSQFSLNPLAENAYVKYPQPQFVGDNRDQFWKVWGQRSFHMGERMRRILTEEDAEQGYRYHDGEGLDVSTWGDTHLQPALARDFAVQSTAMPMTVTTDGARVLVGLSVSPYVKYWENGTWTSAAAVAGSGTVTDLITAGSTLYAIRGGALLTSTDSGANWTVASGGTYTTAQGLAHLSNKLYVVTSNVVQNHTDTTQVAAWGGSFAAAFREHLYWAKDRRIWRWDGRAAYLYDELPSGFNVTALVPYRMVMLVLGYFKVQGGYKGAVYYIMPGTENHLYSLGDYDADYRIYAACGSDNELYIASPKRGGVDRYDLEVGGISAGPATGTAMSIPFKSMAYADGYLFVGRYDNVVGTDGVYIADVASPSTYRSSGWLTTPEYDFGYPHDKKIVRSIEVQHSALAAGESIQVHYSTDSGTTWTSAGTSSTLAATSATFALSSVKGNTLKLKATLNAGTSSLTTPTLKTLTAKAVPVLPAKWLWDLKLVAYAKLQGSAQITALESAVTAENTMAFVDRDGTSYTVVLDDLRIGESFGDKKSAEALVRIRQI